MAIHGNDEWDKNYIAPWWKAFKSFIVFSFLGTMGLFAFVQTNVFIVQLTALIIYVAGFIFYAIPVFKATWGELKEIIYGK